MCKEYGDGFLACAERFWISRWDIGSAIPFSPLLKRRIANATWRQKAILDSYSRRKEYVNTAGGRVWKGRVE